MEGMYVEKNNGSWSGSLVYPERSPQHGYDENEVIGGGRGLIVRVLQSGLFLSRSFLA